MILFGHPAGNPNSHHAALAHFEKGRLAAFCVPWMPSTAALQILKAVPQLRPMAQRLSRRMFPLLEGAPKIQGRLGEFRRLFLRAIGMGGERLSYEANDWVMRTMRHACRRTEVSAVHCYEDASLWQFQEAKRLGKACIYDMPIGYYPAWERKQAELARQFSDWLPAPGLPSEKFVRPEQKRLEMELADLVLAPSLFVENTIRDFYPEKKIARASYGVDLDFWNPRGPSRPPGPLRFIYVGQLSIRKGIPVLLRAWKQAGLTDATLTLVGNWQLAEHSRRELDKTVEYHGPCASWEIRRWFHASDVFLFPSFFEGFALVVLEAMACGLPVVASDAIIGSDMLDDSSGRATQAGDIDGLVHCLRWFSEHRDSLQAMSEAARSKVERFSWERYRQCVSSAVSPFV